MGRAVSHPPASLPRFDRLPVVPGRTPDTGCLSAPDGSDAQKGRLLFEQVVADLAADVAGEVGAAVEEVGATGAAAGVTGQSRAAGGVSSPASIQTS